MPKLEGTTLGRYHLQRRLGSGGMSTVYLAFDEHMQRYVAVKVVSSDYTDYVERFHREAEAIGKLNHAHILPAFDYGEQEPWYYLVMPYIEHGTLRDRLARGRLTLVEVGEMLEQIAGALQFAHDHGIIHRDIKPSNILLRNDHYTYLADFGLAKALEGAHEITQTGSLLGTPEYMAPELAQGPATTSSDIYALGVVLYQMITGRVPFSGETPIAVYLKQLNEQPERPSDFNPSISRSVEQVVLRALDKDPRRRFQSATALAQAYMAALRGPTQYETQEIPPPARLSGVDGPRIPAVPLAAPQPAEGKLILPNPDVAAPTAIPRGSSSQLQSPRSTPSRPPVQPTPPRGSMYRTTTRSSHAARNRLLVTGAIVAFTMLVIVVLINAALHGYGTPVGKTGTPTVTNGTPGHTPTAQQASPSPSTQTTATPNTSATATAHAQSTAQAQATATAGVAGTATSGTPLLADSLNNNTNGRWLEDPAACVFTGSSYHVLVKQTDYLQICGSSTLNYGNASLQVDVSLLSGNDAGMIFRVSGIKFYDFEINNKGEFFLRRHDASAGGGSYNYLLQDTPSTAIAAGGGKNTLLVIANGSDFKLYINTVFVGEAQDSTYSDGSVGFVTGTLNPTGSGEGSFANLKVFKV